MATVDEGASAGGTPHETTVPSASSSSEHFKGATSSSSDRLKAAHSAVAVGEEQLSVAVIGTFREEGMGERDMEVKVRGWERSQSTP